MRGTSGQALKAKNTPGHWFLFEEPKEFQVAINHPSDPGGIAISTNNPTNFGGIAVAANDPSNMGGVSIFGQSIWTASTSAAVFVEAAYSSSSFDFQYPEWARDWLDFKELADKWKAERNPFLSFAGDFANDPNYLGIIWMGPKAIRFILWELVTESIDGHFNHWFPALTILSKGVAPVSEKNRGNVREMAKAWIEWGVKEGHIDREHLVASRISQSR
jgi:hypothetical protein